MSNILLIETATDNCSIGLSQGKDLLALHEINSFNKHGRLITTLIQKCLDEAQLSAQDLDAIAVSSGPGSFTSLRIGIATAKGMCYALNKPLLAIDTMQALAQGAVLETDQEDCYYIPMIDARSMGVYLAVFDKKGKAVAALERKKVEENSFELYTQQVVICGPAALKYEDTIKHSGIDYRPNIINSAQFLHPLALEAYEKEAWANLAYYEPNYIAPPNITVSKKKKRKSIF